MCSTLSATQSCLTLGDPVDYHPPGSSSWDFPSKYLLWVAIFTSRDLPDPGEIKPASPALAGELFTAKPTWKAHLLINYARKVFGVLMSVPPWVFAEASAEFLGFKIFHNYLFVFFEFFFVQV